MFFTQVEREAESMKLIFKLMKRFTFILKRIDLPTSSSLFLLRCKGRITELPRAALIKRSESLLLETGNYSVK